MELSNHTRVSLMARTSSKASVPMACDVDTVESLALLLNGRSAASCTGRPGPHETADRKICNVKPCCATEQLRVRRSPGPIQYHGPTADRANFTLSLELCQGRPIEIA